MLDMPKSEKPSQINRTGTPLSIRVNDPLMDALKAYHESLVPRPTLTALIEHAISEYLDRHATKKRAK